MLGQPPTEPSSINVRHADKDKRTDHLVTYTLDSRPSRCVPILHPPTSLHHASPCQHYRLGSSCFSPLPSAEVPCCSHNFFLGPEISQGPLVHRALPILYQSYLKTVNHVLQWDVCRGWRQWRTRDRGEMNTSQARPVCSLWVPSNCIRQKTAMDVAHTKSSTYFKHHEIFF